MQENGQEIEIHYQGGNKKLFRPLTRRRIGGGLDRKRVVEGSLDREEMSLVSKDPRAGVPEEWKSDPVGFCVQIHEVLR